MILEREEEGRDRERNVVREKHESAASYTNPDWGLSLGPFGIQDDGLTNCTTSATALPPFFRNVPYFTMRILVYL